MSLPKFTCLQEVYDYTGEYADVLHAVLVEVAVSDGMVKCTDWKVAWARTQHMLARMPESEVLLEVVYKFRRRLVVPFPPRCDARNT